MLKEAVETWHICGLVFDEKGRFLNKNEVQCVNLSQSATPAKIKELVALINSLKVTPEEHRIMAMHRIEWKMKEIEK